MTSLTTSPRASLPFSSSLSSIRKEDGNASFPRSSIPSSGPSNYVSGSNESTITSLNNTHNPSLRSPSASIMDSTVSYESMFPSPAPVSPTFRPPLSSGVSNEMDLSSRRSLRPSAASLPRLNTAPSSPRSPLSNSRRNTSTNLPASSSLGSPLTGNTVRARGRPLEVTFGNTSEYNSSSSSSTVNGRRPYTQSGSNDNHSCDNTSEERPNSERRNRVGSHFVLNNLDPSIKRMFRDVIRARAGLLTIILGTQITYKHLTTNLDNIPITSGGMDIPLDGSSFGSPSTSPTKGIGMNSAFSVSTVSDVGFVPSVASIDTHLMSSSPLLSVNPKTDNPETGNDANTLTPEFIAIARKALAYDRMKLEQLVVEALNAQYVRWKEVDKVELNKLRAKEYEIQRQIMERCDEEKRQYTKEHKQTIHQLQTEKSLLINQIIRLKTVVQGMKEPFIFVPMDERKAMNEKLAHEIKEEIERSARTKLLGVEGTASHAIRVIEESQAEVLTKVEGAKSTVPVTGSLTTMPTNDLTLSLTNHDDIAGPAMAEVRGELSRLRAELASTQDTLTLQEKLMAEVVQQNETLQKQTIDFDSTIRQLVQERDNCASVNHKLTDERDALIRTVKRLEEKFNNPDNGVMTVGQSIELSPTLTEGQTSTRTTDEAEEQSIIANAADIVSTDGPLLTVDTTVSETNDISTSSPEAISVRAEEVTCAEEASDVNLLPSATVPVDDPVVPVVIIHATTPVRSVSPRGHNRPSAFQNVYPSPRPIPSPVLISAIPVLQSKLAHVQKEKAIVEGEAERYRLELLETRTQLQVLETLHGELTVEAAVHLALAQGGIQDEQSTVAELVRSRNNSRPGTANNIRPSTANNLRSNPRNRSGSIIRNKPIEPVIPLEKDTVSQPSHPLVDRSSVQPGRIRPLTSSRTAQLTAVAIKVTERDRLRKEVSRLVKHTSTLEHTINGIQKERERYEDTILALQRENRILSEQMKLSDVRYDEMRRWLDLARKQARSSTHGSSSSSVPTTHPPPNAGPSVSISHSSGSRRNSYQDESLM